MAFFAVLYVSDALAKVWRWIELQVLVVLVKVKIYSDSFDLWSRRKIGLAYEHACEAAAWGLVVAALAALVAAAAWQSVRAAVFIHGCCSSY